MSALTLAQLIDQVHAQTQTTTGDLADASITNYLEQAYNRTICVEVRWPFFEQTWDLVLTAGQSSAALAGDVNVPGIMALYDVTNGFRLVQVDNLWAQDHYTGAVVGPGWGAVHYSVWNGVVDFWPKVTQTADKTYRLYGYRRPLTWLTTGDVPDCDQCFHPCFINFAVAMAYAQQEDMELERDYMDRWQRDAETARLQVLAPVHHRPLVMAGSIDSVPISGPSWVLVPPP